MYFCIISLLSLSAVLAVPFAMPAAAADITTPVTVGNNQTFLVSEDTNITLSNSQTGTGLAIMHDTSNATISADAGKVLTITVDTVYTTTGGGRGIYVCSADNAVVSLGETHVKATNYNAVEIDGGLNGNAVTATFGANSTFETVNAGGAIFGTRNAVINVGDDSTITGNSNGLTVAALMQSFGAIITVGDNAKISNQGASGTTNGIAVHSDNGSIGAGYTGGYIEIGDESKIYTTGTGEGNYAVMAGYISAAGPVLYSGDIRIGKSADISTVGGTLTADQGSHALVAAGEGSIITVDDFATISTTGNHAAAVHAGLSVRGVQTGGGTITIGESADISTKGIAAIAVDARYADSKIIIGENSKITTSGTSRSSNGAYGVYAGHGGSVELLSGSSVKTTGATLAHGLLAEGGTAAATITTGNNVTVELTGGFADGVAASSMDATIILGNDNKIYTSGMFSNGVYSGQDGAKVIAGSGLTVSTKGLNSHGAYATGGGQATIGEGAIITTEGVDAYGLFSERAGSYLKLGAGSSVTTDSADAIYSSRGGSIELEGATVSAANGDKNAIAASGGSTASGASTVSGSGVFDITGNMNAGTYGSIDITMDNGSLFTGAARYISDDTTSRLDLTLNGAGTSWNVNNDSWLTNLYMNGATVDMTYAALGAEIYVVNLGSSAADKGLFKMNADMASESADRLYIDRTAQGTYRIDVVNDGSQACHGEEAVDLVFVKQGESVVFILDHVVEQGGWRYELFRPDQDTGATFPTPIANHESNAWYLRGTGRASTPGSGAINSFAGSYLMAYADTQTLIQRMGDLRQSPYGQGLWFRIHGGKFESNSKSYVRGFDMDYGGVQIGYDRKLENKWGGDLYTGIMFGYSKGDLDYHREGSGEVDSKTLGIYGTYIGRSGFYIDTILKYQWMTNDFDVIDTAGTLVRGQEVDTGGIGASVEFGQRLHVGKGKESGIGWYVEPQVQLSYQRQDGGYFNATNGLHIGVEPFTSILGRLGMLVGYETDKTNFYAKVSKVKEFDGDLTVRANGVPISESFASSWWVYGIGCTSRINDRNSLYLDIERTSGGSFSQPWRVLAGWRVEF